MLIGVLLACMSVFHVYVWCPQRSGVKGGCEPPHGSQELNLGPLKEQPMPLTSEPPLQPLYAIS